MPIPSTKKELSEAIQNNYKKLKSELSIIEASVAKKQELEGHAKNTKMSICDLLAYLNGWGQLVLKWNRIKDEGNEPDFPEQGFKWNELGKLAQKFYADQNKHSYESICKQLDETVAEILNLVASKSNTELYGTKWYEKYTLGRMISLNTASPYDNACKRIRKWKKLKGGR